MSNSEVCSGQGTVLITGKVLRQLPSLVIASFSNKYDPPSTIRCNLHVLTRFGIDGYRRQTSQPSGVNRPTYENVSQFFSQQQPSTTNTSAAKTVQRLQKAWQKA